MGKYKIFFLAYFQVSSMCQIPIPIIAKMYILKRNEEVLYIGCTLLDLDRKLKEHKDNDKDKFNKYVVNKHWDWDHISIHLVDEFETKTDGKDPDVATVLNYNCTNEEDMVKMNLFVQRHTEMTRHILNFY
jgi:hypothetical protein